MLGTGISSDTVCLLFSVDMETPFGWENNEFDVDTFSDTSWDKFLISGTDLRLSDNPSLDANDMESGDVWSKDPTKSIDQIHKYH